MIANRKPAARKAGNRGGDRGRGGRGRVRIIGGDCRGRLVEFLPWEGLRPTPDRVRETLFNWLRDDIAGSRCVDLFAGSGVLGFEALSRGAAQLVQVEAQPAVGRQLAATASALGFTQVTLHVGRAKEWIAASGGLPPCDIAFVDPPFSAGILEEVCGQLAAAGVVAAGGKVYLEAAEPLATRVLPGTWTVIKQGRAGDVWFALARVAAGRTA